MMLGYLLARAGLSVTVLEKHSDFLRDFRGDTIHPSTVALLRELGIGDEFLSLPLARISTMDGVIDSTRMTLVDFSTLPEPNDFLVFAPQWDFLNFIADAGSRLPGFDLRMSTTGTDLIVDNGVVNGVRASTNDEDLDFLAPLTVAADGRSSVLREKAGLQPEEFGAPIDVLWFHLPKPEREPPTTLAYMSANGLILTIDRGDYYQAGTVIPKGQFEQLQDAGISSFRQRIVSAVPHLSSVVDTIESWDQVKLLSVQLNRLPTWHRPGFIAIGDAAHAMSPMFGVGVNYAIQDAVALANTVHEELASGKVPEKSLAAVQSRRERPVKKMQRVQRIGHAVLTRTFSGKTKRVVPRPVLRVVKLAAPRIRRMAAKFIGFGYLPEHSKIR